MCALKVDFRENGEIENCALEIAAARAKDEVSSLNLFGINPKNFIDVKAGQNERA